MSTTVTYAQLNIGRNVGNEPMDHARWRAFVSSARAALVHAAGEHRRADPERWAARIADTQVHFGGGWDGVPEDSAYVSLSADTGIDADKLRDLAAILAELSGQDAIALILGSELVTP